MKKLLTTAILAAAGFTAPLASFAQGAAAPPAALAPSPDTAKAPVAAKPEKGSMKTIPFQGKVASIDITAKTFTIKNKDGKENVFTITPKTQILKDDRRAKLDDIQPEEIVRGSRIKIDEGQWEAVKVIIGAKPEKKERIETAKK